MSKVTIYDAKGNPQEVTLDASIYREAAENEMSVSALLEKKYPTNPDKFGSVMEQMAASAGLILRPDAATGLRAPTLATVFNGSAEFQAGVITRDAQPASRILFPAVFLQWVENALHTEFNTQPAIFETMIAVTDTIDGARYEQPQIDFTKPQATRSNGISQGSMPNTMMIVTASDIARKIPTFSLGVEITNEALRAMTIDLLTLSLGRQVAAERDARVEGYISAMVSGDVDHNMAALATVNQTVYDPAAGAGVLTQKAWVKYLFNNFRKRHISHVICDIDTALLIENRTGKPVITQDDANSPRINANFQLLNYKLDQVQMMIVSPGVVPASTVVGLDARYAIHRVRNSQAEYQAAEQFVLKKSEAMRFDFGEVCFRMYDEAWDVLHVA